MIPFSDLFVLWSNSLMERGEHLEGILGFGFLNALFLFKDQTEQNETWLNLSRKTMQLT